jgi:hypothetical protein
MFDIAKLAAASQTVEVSELIEVDGHSAYSIAGIVNQVLTARGYFNGDPKRVPFAGQTFYGLANKGKINGKKHVKGETTRYTDEEIRAFVPKFVARVLADVGMQTTTPKPEIEVADRQAEAVEAPKPSAPKRN